MSANRFAWVQGPDGEWTVAQLGPELFAVRIPGAAVVFSTRDFTIGPVIEPMIRESDTLDELARLGQEFDQS